MFNIKQNIQGVQKISDGSSIQKYQFCSF